LEPVRRENIKVQGTHSVLKHKTAAEYPLLLCVWWHNRTSWCGYLLLTSLCL